MNMGPVKEETEMKAKLIVKVSFDGDTECFLKIKDLFDQEHTFKAIFDDDEQIVRLTGPSF